MIKEVAEVLINQVENIHDVQELIEWSMNAGVIGLDDAESMMNLSIDEARRTVISEINRQTK